MYDLYNFRAILIKSILVSIYKWFCMDNIQMNQLLFLD